MCTAQVLQQTHSKPRHGGKEQFRQPVVIRGDWTAAIIRPVIIIQHKSVRLIIRQINRSPDVLDGTGVDAADLSIPISFKGELQFCRVVTMISTTPQQQKTNCRSVARQRLRYNSNVAKKKLTIWENGYNLPRAGLEGAGHGRFSCVMLRPLSTALVPLA